MIGGENFKKDEVSKALSELNKVYEPYNAFILKSEEGEHIKDGIKERSDRESHFKKVCTEVARRFAEQFKRKDAILDVPLDRFQGLYPVEQFKKLSTTGGVLILDVEQYEPIDSFVAFDDHLRL